MAILIANVLVAINQWQYLRHNLLSLKEKKELESMEGNIVKTYMPIGFVRNARKKSNIKNLSMKLRVTKD